MGTRKNNILIFFTQLILGGFLFVLANQVSAGPAEYQRCKTGTVCVIGEFLYDDEYNPIATASCTLTSRYPDGQVFLNSVAMTAETDGWYYYLVNTSGKPEGLYRSQMCCQATPDYLCLDKSFYLGPSYLTASEAASAVWDAPTSSYSAEGTFGKNLQNPVLTAADIWNYTNRTLSSFGNLVADIWNYTSRSLTNFGTLIADIWGFGERKLTSEELSSGKKLATEEKLKEATEAATTSIKGSSGKDLTQLSAEVASLVTKIDTVQNNINQLINKWGSYSAAQIYQKLDDISSQVSAINNIPNTDQLVSLLNTNLQKNETILNKLIAMEAILSVNRSLLEGLTTDPIVRTWLEVGSIIFKTLAFNPSYKEKKLVKIKFYLPKEFKRENLIKMDDELQLSFDPAENAFYYHAEVGLAPRQSKIFQVEVEDVWQIKKEELESLRRQAEQLFEPLKETSFYAQGAILKSDIDVQLDKVWQLMINAYTPEARIKAYRDASVELASVYQKIDNLKTLLAQAANSRSLLGFVGGISATAVWAIVLIFLIGFGILFYYYQRLEKDERLVEREKNTSSIGNTAQPHFSSQMKRLKPLFLFFIFLSGLMIGILIAFNSQETTGKIQGSIERIRLTPLVSPSLLPSPTAIVQQVSPSVASESGKVLGSTKSSALQPKVTLVVPGDSYLNLRLEPTTQSRVIGRIESTTEAVRLAQTDGWIKVKIFSSSEKKELIGWVASQFVKEEK